MKIINNLNHLIFFKILNNNKNYKNKGKISIIIKILNFNQKIIKIILISKIYFSKNLKNKFNNNNVKIHKNPKQYLKNKMNNHNHNQKVIKQ